MQEVSFAFYSNLDLLEIRRRRPLVLASVNVRINLFFGPKVDEGVSAWFLITRETTLWSVVGRHTSSSMCEALFRQGDNLLSICRNFSCWVVGKFYSGALGKYFCDIMISWMLIWKPIHFIHDIRNVWWLSCIYVTFLEATQFSCDNSTCIFAFGIHHYNPC